MDTSNEKVSGQTHANYGAREPLGGRNPCFDN
jgi:hypothetical protein